MGFRPSKIVRRVHAGQRGLGQPGHADRETAVQRAELLQPLGLLRRARRRSRPTAPAPRGCRRRARGAASRARRPGRSARAGTEWRAREKYSARPARIGHDLDPGRVGRELRRRAGRPRCRCRRPAPPGRSRRPAPRAERNGSSPCTLATTSKPGELRRAPPPRPPGRCPPGGRRAVSTARTPARSTTCAIIGESVATTSSLDHTELHDALNHPGDERLTGQQLERFVGETGRAKTSRNDTQDAHHER